jgi:hypothetical protein
MFAQFLRWRTRRAKNQAGVRQLRNRAPLTVESIEARVLLAAPEIAVLDGAAELVSGTTVPIDFGTVTQGLAGPTRTFSISNEGDASLSLGSVSVPPGFTLIEGLYPTIAERGSDTFTVRLDSSVAGTKTGQIRFNSNDDDENPFSFAITGTVLVGGPEITVLDGSAVVADGSVAAIDFGNVLLGQAGPARTFVVRNDGSQPLTLGNISLPAGFGLTDGIAPTLAPFTSDSFTVQLSPAALGTKAGDISFTSNDADESPFNFAITGTVNSDQLPEVTVLDGFAIISDGAAGPVDFGFATLGLTAPTRTFTVRNDGNDTLTLGAVSVPAGFTLVDGLVTSLTPRATDTFTVQLDTTALGAPAGDVRFSTNDGDESLFNFSVAGTVLAAAPEIRVFHLDAIEMADGGPIFLQFETATRGQTGGTFTLAVANSGTAPLTIGAITLPAGFTLVEGLPASIDPASFDTFTIQLDTTTAGVKAGDIEIASNDADENPFNIAITGTVVGSGSEITVLQGSANVADGGPAPLPFGDGVLREPGPRQTFTVRNDGTSPLVLGGVTVPDRFALIEGLVASLDPGKSDTFTVRLNTSTASTFSGEITIASNDGDENPFNFTIAATVTAAPVPEVTVLDAAGVSIANGTTTAVDFGTPIKRQKGPTRVFTIRNDGSDTLRLGRIELPTGFTLVRGPRRNLAPRGTDTIVVRLDTKIVGVKGGLIRINTNDSDEDPFSFAVTGTVLA